MKRVLEYIYFSDKIITTTPVNNCKDGKEVSRDSREKLDLSTQKQHASSDRWGLSNSVSSPSVS